MENGGLLAGEHIRIAGFEPRDKEILFRWINDPEIVKFNAPFRPVDWAAHCVWWDGLNKDDRKRSFAIRSLSDDRIIGTVQLVGIHPVHQHAEVSIRIGDQGDREKGGGTEALRLLARIGFDHLNLHRIFTYVWADNERAIRAYAKAGFEREGLLRQHVFIQGEWKDVVVMGILRS